MKHPSPRPFSVSYAGSGISRARNTRSLYTPSVLLAGRMGECWVNALQTIMFNKQASSPSAASNCILQECGFWNCHFHGLLAMYGVSKCIPALHLVQSMNSLLAA